MAHEPHPHYLCDYGLPFGYLGMSHALTAVHLYYTAWTTPIISLLVRPASYLSNIWICLG